MLLDIAKAFYTINWCYISWILSESRTTKKWDFTLILHAGSSGFCLPSERISTTSAISVLRNYRKRKHFLYYNVPNKSNTTGVKNITAVYNVLALPHSREWLVIWGTMVNGIPDSKVYGANMGPIWGRQDPGGPHVGPMNFAIWDSILVSSVDEDNGSRSLRSRRTYVDGLYICIGELLLTFWPLGDVEIMLRDWGHNHTTPFSKRNCPDISMDRYMLSVATWCMYGCVWCSHIWKN